MKRVDRLIDEARLLRVSRALRAQGRQVVRLGDVDWQSECDIAGRILESLSECQEDCPDRLAIDVVDRAPALALVPRIVEALRALLTAEVEAAIIEGSMAKLDAYLGDLARSRGQGSKGQGSGSGVQPAEARPQRLDKRGRPVARFDERARRSTTMRDVADLVVEAAVFEALRRSIESRDAEREVRDYGYAETIRIEQGRVKRRRPPRPVAGRGKAKKTVAGS